MNRPPTPEAVAALARLNAQIDLSEKALGMLSSGPFATIEEAVARSIHLSDALRAEQSHAEAKLARVAVDRLPPAQSHALDVQMGLEKAEHAVHFDARTKKQTFGKPREDASAPVDLTEAAFAAVTDQINRAPRVVVEDGVVQSFGVRKEDA